MGEPGTSLRQRLFARFMAAADGDSLEMYGERKSSLLASLRGTVVEIGPGTGVNLQFFHPSVHWVGLEPNRAMHGHIQSRAKQLGRNVDLRTETLDECGLPYESADALVSTLVLCSVPSVPRLLDRVLQLLKPEGQFVFLEHVADARGTLRRLLQTIAPCTPYRYFADGCHPGREIGKSIAEAGFSEVKLELYKQQGPGIIMALNRPHIAGIATK